MSESGGVAGRRRRRSRVEAERLVLEYEQSGLGRQDFCLQHGLSVAALDKYRRRFRPLEKGKRQARLANRGPQRQVLGAGVGSRIVPVELVAGLAPGAPVRAERRSGLWVELANGRRIEVAHEFDALTLERLVAVLETPTSKVRLPGTPLEKA